MGPLAKEYWAISHKSYVRPVCLRRSDLVRSWTMAFLNALYSGWVLTTAGYCYATVGHHLMVLDPQCLAGTVAFFWIARTTSDAARGCCYRLLKNLQHYLWHKSYALSQLPTTYKTLLRVSHLARVAHLNTSRAKSSTRLKVGSAANIVITLSLRHAKIGAPNSRTEVTRDVASCNLTLQFYKPSSLALFLILQKAILADLSLHATIWAGDFA